MFGVLVELEGVKEQVAPAIVSCGVVGLVEQLNVYVRPSDGIGPTRLKVVFADS